ncbi:anti-sigma factor ChrR (cupin superfamily) [Litorivivens lipolytica]|uniref:Anti-sigma factor ChrR (Cupin superfamily) n=1 Tax=Litorivivens lipolytica TaxID=1524264 RepID=A0A7W4Z6T2_9GAMM|nr:zf-HC2 domain-containing protein [Litorivivens lipolytica]MBB3047285.1 anti-sigma factor ChrR (cupin superfamily) [Litorivivens lipolytica]
MLKCREVVHQADALLAGELSRRERFVLQMHLIICRHCRRYIRQFEWLLRAIPRMHGSASEAEISSVLKAVENAEKSTFK